MNERQTLSILGWTLSAVVGLAFILDAVALIPG